MAKFKRGDKHAGGVRSRSISGVDAKGGPKGRAKRAILSGVVGNRRKAVFFMAKFKWRIRTPEGFGEFMNAININFKVSWLKFGEVI